MKFKAITAVLAAAATTGVVGAPIVSAEPAEPVAAETTAPATPQVTTTSLGSQAKLLDGTVIQGWTISDLKPSTDVIPHPVVGTLWEATATDQAIQGSVIPIVPNLNARAADGQTYRALFGAATPQGVNPATIAQGQETTGKVYFDVTGASPDSVVYNAGGVDLAIWTQPAPSASDAPSTSYGSYSSSPAAPAESAPAEAAPAEGAPAAEVPAATPAATPAEASAPLPEGSQGTPLREGSTGTPLPAAAPAAAPPAEGTPTSASAEGTPLPAGSQGTPVIPGDEQVPTPTTYTPAPTP